MKIIHEDNGFRPLTVVIETRAEAEDLKNLVGTSPHYGDGGVSVKLFSALCSALKVEED